jgi:hypothetical protein
MGILCCIKRCDGIYPVFGVLVGGGRPASVAGLKFNMGEKGR